MLASNFKTADELGLVPEAVPALIKVLGLLERGELAWVTWERPCKIKNGFNMAPHWVSDQCGSMGCILGWARQLEPAICAKLYSSLCPTQDQIYQMGRLTTPPYASHRTVAEAAHALRTYLVTGTADWG